MSTDVVRVRSIEKFGAGQSRRRDFVCMLDVDGSFFTSNESFRLVGVQLDDLGDGPAVLFGQNKNLVADMEAAHYTFDLTGSSAIISCIKCANCVKKGVLTDTAHPLPNPNGRLADITSETLAAFVPNTNKAIFDNVDELQRLSCLLNQRC